MLLSLASASHARCDLKFFEEDIDNWRNISSGYLMGLYEDPQFNQTECYDCWLFGNYMALLNKGLVHVENMRDQWIDQTSVTSLNVFEISQKLLEIYIIFLAVLLPMDYILQNDKLVSIPK